jgi:hypothetical protein
MQRERHKKHSLLFLFYFAMLWLAYEKYMEAGIIITHL